MENKLIYIYQCTSCEEIYSTHEEIRYCNSKPCVDKDVELKLLATVEEGVVLSWSNGVEWGEIEHPHLGKVMTYWKTGTPCYDTYTAPRVDDDGEIYCYRFDHDEGFWLEDTYYLGLYNGINTCKFS